MNQVENFLRDEKERVESLLRDEKERIIASDKQKRDNHLISIGLIDKAKTNRIYSGETGYDPYNNTYDEEKKKFFSEALVALEVTDEEYEEICKYFSPTLTQTQKEILKTATAAENTLNVIAIIVLVCGIIGALICLSTIAFVGRYNDFEPIGFVVSIGVLLTSLITWAILRIICEIAINLRQINNKAK